MKFKNAVLILDANQRSALAATRSLGSKDIVVITADCTSKSLAGSSRFSKRYLQYPDPQTSPNEFIKYLSRAIDCFGVTVLLPMTETTAPLILSNRNEFSSVCIPFAEQRQVESISNKFELMQLATSLSVPIPDTHYIENLDQILRLTNTLSYPVVLKPFKSKIWDSESGTWIAGSVTYVLDETELISLVKSNPVFLRHPFLVQKLIEGQGHGVFVAYEEGKLVACFAHRRLREKPPSGGVSVLSESAPLEQDLLAFAKKLLDQANWHGVAMVEFKVDTDGRPFLMEINTRFWGSLQLAIDAGVDFPYLLYQIAIGSDARPTSPQLFKTGNRLRWLLGDLSRLYICLTQRDSSLRDKMREILAFLNFFDRNTRLEVLRWHDLKPFIYECKNFFK